VLRYLHENGSGATTESRTMFFEHFEGNMEKALKAAVDEMKTREQRSITLAAMRRAINDK
jgi:hypothetical protein